MLELVEQCRNNVATLCCAKNRRCESCSVTPPLESIACEQALPGDQRKVSILSEVRVDCSVAKQSHCPRKQRQSHGYVSNHKIPQKSDALRKSKRTQEENKEGVKSCKV